MFSDSPQPVHLLVTSPRGVSLKSPSLIGQGAVHPPGFFCQLSVSDRFVQTLIDSVEDSNHMPHRGAPDGCALDGVLSDANLALM